MFPEKGSQTRENFVHTLIKRIHVYVTPPMLLFHNCLKIKKKKKKGEGKKTQLSLFVQPNMKAFCFAISLGFHFFLRASVLGKFKTVNLC